jgi:hypothetical protein
MRRCSQAVLPMAAAAMRFHGAAAPSAGGKKYDLFGYEVDMNTKPWIEKIGKVKYYDEAGELLVEMNVKNCPPDLATYNATLEKIYTAPSKQAEKVDNESKFCAMMDLLEEMSHRNKVKPDQTSWTWVMKECVSSKNFRIGRVIERVMQKECGGCPAELTQANEANATAMANEGKEHPSHLSKQHGLFDIDIV